jgi:hypothetical protein
MNRSFPPPAREALCVLVGALVCGAACSPDQNVKPGAPELIEFTIVQAGPTATTVTPTTPACPNPVQSGDACLPMGIPAGADGGVETPPDALCREANNNLWCNCVPDASDMTGTTGAWSCEPFTNVMAVIAVFDRLLDTAPLDPGDAAGLTDVVMADVSASAIDVLTDYSSTGAANGFIFNLFGPAFFGNFRANGPSLYTAPQPIFPSGETVTVTLDATKVRAKDGTTPFKGEGLLQSGTLIFTMAPYSASVTAPAEPTMDNPDPPISATVSFTNFTDPTDHITATANGAPVVIDVESADGGATFSVTPHSGSWGPTGTTVVVTVDATTQNLAGQTIAAAASTTFTAR